MAYDPKSVEPAVLSFWQNNSIYEKAKKKVSGKKKYYFLDGPPYTSGRVHIGTAWNKALKDMILRYKRMSGFDVWDRAGYDMHGLPTENKVRKKHNIFLKKEIEAFGVDKFTAECEKYSVEMMGQMNETFKRLGVWMDFENAYKPITRGFINGEWFLAKKAHDQKRLYEGLRTMPWCATCQTNMAKHELEYATVSDDSIFVKLQVKGKKNEFLVIWTTTPWTIPMNLAVMVNPELDYVRAQVDGEVWIIAKALAGALVAGIAEKQMTVKEEMKGAKLEGIEYIHPFADVIPEFKEMKKKHPKLHTIVLSTEYVDTSAGSGLVHCAPGCGPEDYEVGHRNGLPAWNIVDESGKFPEMKEFGGLIAKKDDKKFVEALKNRGALISSVKVQHDYPHCQRCKNPVIYRTTKQWFFKVEDLKEKLIKENNKIKWVPEAAYNAFDSWLKNLRDNSITKQNFWGTPVPIWKCGKCENYDVFGSIEDLEKTAKGKVDKLHRPWIDTLTFPCKCGGTKKRIEDVFDVWVDAGTVSWNCLDFPQRKDLFNKLFPADFILEGKDQIRGWFNLLLIASMLAFGKPSFKAVYMHGFIEDAKGRKMSKTLGNQIQPEEVIEEFGADVLRYYQIGSANPGVDQMYNHEDIKLKYKKMLVLWNVNNFLIDLCKTLNFRPLGFKPNLDLPEKFILSRLNSTLKNVTDAFEQYRLDEIPWFIEDLYLDLSRTYIQLVREKASTGTDVEKRAVAVTLYKVMSDIITLMSPIMPFLAEQMYQNLKEAFSLKESSVHLLDYPRADEKKIDKRLESGFKISATIIQAALYAREKAKYGVRWPVKGVIVLTTNNDVKKAVTDLAEIIKTQANVKEVHVQETFPEAVEKVFVNQPAIGKQFKQDAPAIMKALEKVNLKEVADALKKGNYELKEPKVTLTNEHFTMTRTVPPHLIEVPFNAGIVYLDKEVNEAMEAEGYAREVTRRIQDARKKAGLEKADVIELHIEAKESLLEMLNPWIKHIREKCNAKRARLDALPPTKKHLHRSTEQVKDEIFSIHFGVIGH